MGYQDFDKYIEKYGSDKLFDLLFSKRLSIPVTVVLEMWSEPHRYYHNTDHLSGALKGAIEVAKPYYIIKDDWWLLALCILYHDAVYIPGSKNNEYLSSILFENDLRPHLSEDALNEGVRIIAGTTSHKAPSTLLQAIMFDVDLWGLGADWTTYSRNYNGVMREYLQVFTSNEFRDGRISWLRGMLGRPQIYYTTLGAVRESVARNNMQAELDMHLMLKEDWS